MRELAFLFLVAAVLFAAGCATAPPADVAETATKESDTYVLTAIYYTGELAPKGIALRESSTRKRVKLMSRGEFILKKIKPGDYYLSDIYSVYDDVGPTRYDQPDRLINIVAGKINYIGDVLVISRESRGGYNASAISSIFQYRVNFDTVKAAYKDKQELFDELETVVSQAGMAPYVVTVSTRKRNRVVENFAVDPFQYLVDGTWDWETDDNACTKPATHSFSIDRSRMYIARPGGSYIGDGVPRPEVEYKIIDVRDGEIDMDLVGEVRKDPDGNLVRWTLVMLSESSYCWRANYFAKDGCTATISKCPHSGAN